MGLTIENVFKLKGKKGEEAIFSSLILNDEKELEFKFCSFFNGRVFVNREKRALELKDKKRTIYLLLRGENEPFFNELMEIRKAILMDLHELSFNFKKDKEPIYIINTNNQTHPYFITTPTVLEKGLLSPKYVKGMLFFINQALKDAGKEIVIKNEEDLLILSETALEKVDFSPLTKKKLNKEDIYYELSTKEFVSYF